MYEGGEGEYVFHLARHRYDGVGKNTLFDVGLYRLVFFLDDGPHYVNFGIFYMPE